MSKQSWVLGRGWGVLTVAALILSGCGRRTAPEAGREVPASPALDQTPQNPAEAEPESRPGPRRKPLGHLGLKEEFLVFQQVGPERTALSAQHLASGKITPLLEGERGNDLDYVPSPDGTRLLIIEWNEGHPAWNYKYWARVVLLDLKSLVLRELVGPEEFPSLPMWIDDQRVAVLLEGRKGVLLNTETLERQKPVLLPAYPQDKGVSIKYGDDLQLVYVRRLGSGMRLQRTAQLIKETNPLVGFLAFFGKDVYKVSQVGDFGLPQCVIPSLLRSFGLPQFPSDWMLVSVPMREQGMMGDGLRRMRARKPELSLSPDGNFVAYSGLRNPAQGWEGGFEVGILDLRSKKKVSRIELVDADAFRFHWTADSRWVVYTQEGDSPPGFGSPGLWLLERGSSRGLFLGEGENGYLVSGPVGEAGGSPSIGKGKALSTIAEGTAGGKEKSHVQSD